LAQDNGLTQQKNQWFFRIAQNADSFGLKAAEWATEKLKVKSVFVLARNDNYGQSNADSFVAGLKTKGMQPVGQASYEPTAKDFRAVLQKVAEVKPDLVAIMGFYTDAGLIVKQMSEMQIKSSIYANTAPGLPQFAEIAGPAARGVYGALYYYAGSVSSDVGRKFVDSWKAKHKRTPSQYEGMGYESMRVMVHALQTLPDPAKATSEQLRAALGRVNGYDGATGRISFKPNGDVDRPLPFVRLGADGLALDSLVQ
jgi:branched-chain amino acid transport system substrate-binding protein